jgi:hypothetical protein
MVRKGRIAGKERKERKEEYGVDGSGGMSLVGGFVHLVKAAVAIEVKLFDEFVKGLVCHNFALRSKRKLVKLGLRDLGQHDLP